MHSLFRAIFPEQCILCRKQGTILCQNHALFARQQTKGEFGVCHGDIQALSRYTDHRIQKIVKAYKYYGKRSLGPILGAEMRAICPEGDWVIVPMPLHWSRLLWRGFNQADLLAKEIAILPRKTLCRDLKRVKHTKQQARLDKEDRQKNMQGVFLWKGDSLEGKNILIVDDVLSSGATFKAAKDVLAQYKPVRIAGIVLAV